MNVEVALSRPIAIHVVDATSDLNGIEDGCMRAMTAALRDGRTLAIRPIPSLSRSRVLPARVRSVRRARTC